MHQYTPWLFGSFEAMGQAYQALPAVLQRLQSIVCSAVDPSLREEIPNAVQGLLLRDIMKTVIQKSCVDLSLRGSINSGLRETYRL